MSNIYSIIIEFELPFFIGMGVKKGMAAKEVFIFSAFFVAFAYLWYLANQLQQKDTISIPPNDDSDDEEQLSLDI